MPFIQPTACGQMKYDIIGVTIADLKDPVETAHMLQHSVTVFAL